MTAVVDDGRFIGFDETIVLAEGTAFADYLEWLEGTHPEEVELAAQLEWGSVEEAVAAGEARARYVDEWALRSRDSRRHDWIIRPTWGGRPTKLPVTRYRAASRNPCALAPPFIHILQRKPISPRFRMVRVWEIGASEWGSRASSSGELHSRRRGSPGE